VPTIFFNSLDRANGQSPIICVMVCVITPHSSAF
jgi:hypothetical protein